MVSSSAAVSGAISRRFCMERWKKIRVRQLKVLAPVYPAGGQAVTEHLRHILFGHLHADDALAPNAVIRPVLKVVTVPALVVEPGGAVSPLPPLSVIGAAVPLEIFYACPELDGGILRQVMGQSLPVKAQTEAILPHQAAVMADGFQMAPEVQETSLRFFRFMVQYSTAAIKRREKFSHGTCRPGRH